jgi:DNA-binding NtrC family response regulator
VDPLARVIMTGDTLEELAHLLSLLRIESRLCINKDEAGILVEFDSTPEAPSIPAVRLLMGSRSTQDDADFVCDDTRAAACFVMSRALGLDQPFLTSDDEVFSMVRAALAVASSSARIVVEGGIGTGKKSLVGLIHAASRSCANLIRLNCAELDVPAGGFAAIAENADRVNYGHDQSGKDASQLVFLDRIAELSPAAQIKLVEVLRAQRKSARPAHRPPARYIAATNRPLAQMVAQGSFSSALLRMFGVTLVLPPLWHRRGDVALLARHFLRNANPDLILSAGAAKALCEYPFPGNLRELQNLAIRFAIAVYGTNEISQADVLNQLVPANPTGIADP